MPAYSICNEEMKEMNYADIKYCDVANGEGVACIFVCQRMHASLQRMF